MRWSPHVTVAAVIRRDERFLMVEERPDGVSVINQPAGHLEFGESLVDAVKREVLEETCRCFRADGLVGLYQWTVPDTQRTYLRVCFAGAVGDPVTDCVRDADILDDHWLTLSEIEQGLLPMRSPLVARCLRDAMDRPLLDLGVLHALC